MIIKRPFLQAGIFVLLLMSISLVRAAPGNPTIVGPTTGAAGEFLTYTVTNVQGSPFSILSSTGIWVRSIVAPPGTTCQIDDGGTEDIILCDADYRVTISSDLGQQLQLKLGAAALTVGITGDHILPDDSLVHIYNGLVPAGPAISQANPNPPVTTNAMLGSYTSYQLAALNFSSDITRTFDITLTIPLDVAVTTWPAGCSSAADGVYNCSLTVGPHDWQSVGFEVHWTAAGIKPLTAVGFIRGVEDGRDTRLGNVLTVSTSQTYLPLARR